ncbi:MAG: ARPP-1 family domain-containing protein [Candidatus Aminicenantaceae bacterium]
MDTVVKKYLKSFKFADLQHCKNMGVIPLLTDLNHTPEYLTLKDALDKQVLAISEVSQEGAVPELKVTNKGDLPVLLLDGEELTGAKQNRVLNTTILLKEKSETIIPVSCTEQGRWSYTSKDFSDSGTVMIPKIRVMKAQTVSDSLEESSQYRSDQGTVWTAIDEMSEEAEARSQTGAMRDVFEARMSDLDEYLEAFTSVPHQRGLIAFIDEEIVGFDFLSLESAYTQLHQKLVKSYAMESLLRKDPKLNKPDAKMAKAFIDEALKCDEKKYESIGKGWDYRYEGRLMVGSALKFEKKVIHTAFFRITESEKAGKIAGFRRRRSYRTD